MNATPICPRLLPENSHAVAPPKLSRYLTMKTGDKPDDTAVLNLLDDWAPTVAVRHRILVNNPAKLYGFCPL
jgi:hypothetical protein